MRLFTEGEEAWVQYDPQLNWPLLLCSLSENSGCFCTAFCMETKPEADTTCCKASFPSAPEQRHYDC